MSSGLEGKGSVFAKPAEKDMMVYCDITYKIEYIYDA